MNRLSRRYWSLGPLSLDENAPLAMDAAQQPLSKRPTSDVETTQQRTLPSKLNSLSLSEHATVRSPLGSLAACLFFLGRLVDMLIPPGKNQ